MQTEKPKKLIQKVYYTGDKKLLLLTIPVAMKDKLNLNKGDTVIVFANEFFATIEKGYLEEPEGDRVCMKLYQGSNSRRLIMTVPALMRKKLKLEAGDNVVITISDCGIVIVEKVKI